MRVFLVGATGVIGRSLVPRLLERGHEVIAMTRRAARSEALTSAGAQPVVCDVLDRPRLGAALRRARPDAVVSQLTEIPARMHPRRVVTAMAPTNRLRTEGTAILAGACSDLGVGRFISQSIAFAYAPSDGGPAEEHDPLFDAAPHAFAPLVRAVSDCEHITLAAAGGEGIVLRYGHFYGPGTVYAADGRLAEDVRRRRVPLVGAGSGVFSFIHVNDAAAATVLALEIGDPGIYNVVDDEPVPIHTWLPAYARLLDARPPFHVPRALGRLVGGAFGDYLTIQQRGASNAHAKVRLGWTPSYRTWREGFEALLNRKTT